MSFCSNCGKENLDGAAFCGACGTAVPERKVEEAPVVEATPVVESAPVADTPVMVAQPVVQTVNDDYLLKEEQDFLDLTHNLLRWERKSWSIFSKFYLIFGIIYAALFGFIAFIGLIAAANGDSEAIAATVAGILYAIMLGGMFIVLGIVYKKAADKILLYTSTLYDDFTYANNRCGNVGMMVFTIIFGGVHTVFFIVNFVRIKSSSHIIARILARQGKN